MNLSLLQEDLLRTSARENGTYLDLLYFYSVQRDLGKIFEIGTELGRESTSEKLIHALLTGNEGVLGLLDQHLESVTDLWVLYTVAKFLLQENRVDLALCVALRCLKVCERETLILNLVARHACARGDSALAAELAERSLRLNPCQDNVANMQPAPFYLEVFPKQEKVGFYVPTYNVENYIETAITGILVQNYPLNEIIVINDGSSDRSVELARKYPVRIIEHGENRGLAAARNTAFFNADSDFLGAIDTDAIPGAHYARNIMMEFENGPADLAGVGGQLVEMNTQHPADKWRARHMPQTLGAVRKCPADILFGSNTILRRDAIRHVGGYHERHRTNGEDVYMSRALRAHGFRLVYCPQAIAYHLRTDTVASVLKTIWDWRFWARHDAGHYRNAPALVNSMRSVVRDLAQLVYGEIESGNGRLVFISFLHIFSTLFNDINHGVREGIFSTEQGRTMQDRILASVKQVDARFGKGQEDGLYGRVAAAIAHLRLEAPVRENALAPAALDGTINALAQFFDSVDEPLYRVLMVSSGGS